ncbi:MAG: DUF481 domain-containing protein [Deltaproteobacteria bacterium]
MRLFFPLLILLWWFSLAHADVVWLKNGDRMSGEILSKTGDKLKFRSVYAGDIEIKWQEVDRFSSDKAMAFLLRDNNRLVGRAVALEQSRISIEAGSVLKTAPLAPADIVTIHPSEYKESTTKLSGRLNVGITSRRGNTDTGSMHMDGELVARTKKNRYTVGGSYNWEQDSGTETESNLSLYSKYDHFLDKNWYLSTKVSFLRDRFQDVKLRSLLGGSLGYQVWETEVRNLSMEAGVDYVNEDFFQAPDDDYPGARWGLHYDQFLFGRLTQFFHQHEVSVGVKDVKDILLSSETGFRFPLKKNFSATLKYDYDWDNTPSPGKNRSDSAYMLNVGYHW